MEKFLEWATVLSPAIASVIIGIASLLIRKFINGIRKRMDNNQSASDKLVERFTEQINAMGRKVDYLTEQNNKLTDQLRSKR